MSIETPAENIERQTARVDDVVAAERQIERMQPVIAAVRELELRLPKHMYVQPRFRRLFQALHCLDGPLFDNEPDWCHQ